MVLGEKICVRCGRKSLGWHYGPEEDHPKDDGLCPDCRGDDFAAADIEDGETEFTGEEERCPWCGKRIHHEHGEDGDIFFGDGIKACPNCGKRYEVTTETHFTYNTRRVET